MKTPILDEKIRDLENIKSLDEISEFGEKMLSEFKGIKSALNLHIVSNNEARVTVCCSTCKHVGKFGEDSACNNCFQNYNKWEQAN